MLGDLGSVDFFIEAVGDGPTDLRDTMLRILLTRLSGVVPARKYHRDGRFTATEHSPSSRVW